MTIGILILAVLFGYIRKGRLKNIAQSDIKLVPLMVLSLLLQIGIPLAYAFDIEMIKNYDILIHFVSYILLLAALMGNFQNKWFILITIGVVMNFVAIFLNGGKMSVSFDAGARINLDEQMMNEMLSKRAGTHQALGEDTLLPVLSDIIPIGFPGALSFLSNIYSLGDMVIYIGIFGLVQSLMMENGEVEEGEEIATIEEDQKKLKDKVYEEFPPMDPMEEAFLFENKKERSKRETTIKCEEDHMNSGEETIVLNTNPSMDDTGDLGRTSNPFIMDVDPSSGDEESERESLSLDFNKFDTGESVEEEIEAPGEPTLTSFTSVGDEGEIGDSSFKEEPEIFSFEEDSPLEDEEKDTTHQFIIVDGKIRENPNFHFPNHHVDLQQNENTTPIDLKVTEEDITGEEIEEVELTNTKLNQDDEVDTEDDLLRNQEFSDNDRLEWLKKVKQREEEGYALVEIEVGGKKVKFWRKDL